MNFTRRLRAAGAALFAPALSRVVEVEMNELQLQLVEAKLQELTARNKVALLQAQIHYLVLTHAALNEPAGSPLANEELPDLFTKYHPPPRTPQ